MGVHVLSHLLEFLDFFLVKLLVRRSKEKSVSMCEYLNCVSKVRNVSTYTVYQRPGMWALTLCIKVRNVSTYTVYQRSGMSTFVLTLCIKGQECEYLYCVLKARNVSTYCVSKARNVSTYTVYQRPEMWVLILCIKGQECEHLHCVSKARNVSTYTVYQRPGMCVWSLHLHLWQPSYWTSLSQRSPGSNLTT